MVVRRQLRFTPKARYVGVEPNLAYYRVNGHLRFPRPNQENSQLVANEGPTEFHRMASVVGTEFFVKVVQLPVVIPSGFSANAIREVEMLRASGVLTELRGGRFTEIARPISRQVRDIIRITARSLITLIELVENAVAGGELFLRTIKFENARRSTTSVDANILSENLHYDAELSSLAEYSGPVYQFYMNVATEPRQMRILPLTLREISRFLVEWTLITEDAVRTVSPKEQLELFKREAESVVEEIVVESGQMTVFNGRVFAHDAGKGRLEALARGVFFPSAEPDLVFALDTTITRYHVGFYNPELSFLDDVSNE